MDRCDRVLARNERLRNGRKFDGSRNRRRGKCQAPRRGKIFAAGLASAEDATLARCVSAALPEWPAASATGHSCGGCAAVPNGRCGRAERHSACLIPGSGGRTGIVVRLSYLHVRRSMTVPNLHLFTHATATWSNADIAATARFALLALLVPPALFTAVATAIERRGGRRGLRALWAGATAPLLVYIALERIDLSRSVQRGSLRRSVVGLFVTLSSRRSLQCRSPPVQRRSPPLVRHRHGRVRNWFAPSRGSQPDPLVRYS